MIKRYGMSFILLTALLFLVGCATEQYSRLEMDYGTSFNLSRFNQTLNPDAEKNLEPVYGLDGQAAGKTLDRYRKGFEKEDKKSSYTINIGK